MSQFDKYDFHTNKEPKPDEPVFTESGRLDFKQVQVGWDARNVSCRFYPYHGSSVLPFIHTTARLNPSNPVSSTCLSSITIDNPVNLYNYV